MIWRRARCKNAATMLRFLAVGFVAAFVACSTPRRNETEIDASTSHGDGRLSDGTGSSDDAHATDSGSHDASMQDATSGVISGGPCLSGAPGATAYRIRWANGGSTTYPVYETNGLPDHSRDHTGAYGYQIGFTPSYVDMFLGAGGLQLDGSDFVDIEITTAGVSHITSATLAIYGRSYNTTTSGSFNWQTFVGTGSSPTNSVSNTAPYVWYSADMTSEIAPNDASTLIRIKAGPSSGSLVVNRIELCMQAS
jgi:hypothetical protein